jgi:hypothetical protein
LNHLNQNADVSDRLFKIGDVVHLRAAARQAFACLQTFKIVATLPLEGNSRKYRIRSEQEPYERVVTEDCLETWYVA